MTIWTSSPAGTRASISLRKFKFDGSGDWLFPRRGAQGLLDHARNLIVIDGSRPARTSLIHDKAVIVTSCGRICFNRQKINLSLVFAGQKAGIKQVDQHIWLVSFMHYDLGYFDDETCRLEPLQNPFGPKVLPLSSV